MTTRSKRILPPTGGAIYTIERLGSQPTYVRYRFLSLYNGVRGTVVETEAEAVKQGERHQEIVFAIHEPDSSIRRRI